MTQFDEIYEKATALIKSFTFVALPQEVFERYAKLWIDKAGAIDFQDCIHDLSLANYELGFFPFILSDTEQWIIAHSILLSWYNYLLRDETYTKVGLGDRDYKNYSPANLLAKMSDVAKDIKKDMEKMIESYSYSNGWF